MTLDDRKVKYGKQSVKAKKTQERIELGHRIDRHVKGRGELAGQLSLSSGGIDKVLV